ncbi:MAG: phage holin family protein [Defluviitaleaceae bacterium]|nr:phage holin family protein [Defluviitaleaceae bacterium]
MSKKDFYDEDEIIKNINNEEMPDWKEDFQNHLWRETTGQPHLRVQRVRLGCFNVRKLLTNFVIYSVVLMVTAGLFPGFYLDGIFAAIQAAFILTLLNTFVKPIIVLFTFPLTIATLGFFYFIINGMIMMLTAGMMGYSFVITNFFVAFLTAIFISILQNFIRKKILKVDQL